MMPLMVPVDPERLSDEQREAYEQQKALHEARQRFEEAAADLEVAERRQMLRWGFLFCLCRLPYNGLKQREERCPVHEQIMFHWRTGELVTWP